MTIRTRNLILTIAAFALVAFALRTEGLSDSTRTALITAAFAFVTGLWMHSGRPPGGGLTAVTLACAAQLAYGCDQGPLDYCAVGHVTRGAPAAAPATQRPQLGTLQVPGDLDVLGGTNADYVRFTAQGATPAACATPYGCSFYSSVDGLMHQTNAAGTDYASGTAHRARIVAGTPGDVAISWLWHDSVTGYLMWRSPTGSVVIGSATGMPFTSPVISGTITGTYNIGGTPTFTVAPVFGAGATASGAVAFNLSGSSGAFSAPTGASTFGGSSNAFTNAATFNGGVTLGDAAADIILNKGTWRIENTANTFYVALTHAATANRAVTLPDAAGAILLDSTVINASQIGAGDIAAARINNALLAPGPIGSGTANTGAFSTLAVAGAATTATFFKTCTISSASASVAVNCLAAADVPSALSAKLAKWHAKVNGAVAWATTTTCTIEDSAGNDLVVIPVAALTANAFVSDHTASLTYADRYALGTGGATDEGLRIVCDANGTGSDLVFVLSGNIQ